MKANPVSPGFGTLIQAFFCDRLIQQQNVSPRTVSSYRDTFRLLLGFLEQQHKKPPATVTLADLDTPTVVSFLDHLENRRQNGIRTRNARLAAIRSFLKYAASRDPVSLPVVQRVLAIPMKRFARPALTFLSRDEVAALLKAPDDSTWSGRRDRVLFAVLYNTGARVSEAIALRRADISLDGSRSVQLTGKGRKQRTVPLWKSTVESLRTWMALLSPAPETLLFPNRAGQPLSRSGVEKRLGEVMRVVAARHPSVREKRSRRTRCDTRQPCTFCNPA